MRVGPSEVDSPPRRPDARDVAVYDKLDWHYDSAVAAGQPPENAFTHIGFYLAWLFRRDLHNPELLPREHLAAVKRGEMTGSDLADDVDTKLVDHLMTAEGRAFSEARYEAYTTAYGEVFAELPDYGVVDDEANYRRAEELLNRLYSEWVAGGRPEASPEPESGRDVPMPKSISVMLPPGFSHDALGDLLGPWADVERTVIRPPTAEEQHVAPDLEALIPVDLTSPPMELSSVRAADWGSSLLKRALRRLEVRPRDAVVVNALGGRGRHTLTIILYGVPGASAERLTGEFRTVVEGDPGSEWQPRVVAGKRVSWASGEELTQAYWTVDGLVLSVAGHSDDVERVISRLP